MAKQTTHPDRLIADLAGAQHGIVTFRQLITLGLTPTQVAHRVGCGRLHRIHRGIFQVGARTESATAAWMAAVLAYGNGSSLSHRSSAQCCGLLLLGELRPIHVTVTNGLHARPGIQVHQARLPPSQRIVTDGIPATSMARTIFDLASSEPQWLVEKALRTAEVKEPATGQALAKLVDEHPGHRGIRMLRAILGGSGLARSELEARFRRFLEFHKLPSCEVNAVLDLGGGRCEVDCLWRRQRLVVELDGRAFHIGSQAFEADRKRDRLLQAAGWRVIRLTWRQIHDDSVAVAHDLRRLLA